MLRRILASIFVFFVVAALWQCARRGNPTGGPKDLDPPVLVKAEPENMSVNFKAKKIRLYFDEFIKLKDIQDQLIVSPPLKYTPDITPQGSASKYLEIKFKDTLKENTTYTLNFGQSITDNNEGNPFSFFTYVFSTGDYLDSLKVQGAVKDAFNKKAEEFISVMLYEIDSAYTDSTVYQKPPYYITNTLDSAVIFTLDHLKAGKYALFGIKDIAKNNVFDQNTDKIAFVSDTISIPTDSTYLLNLFKEIPDYSVAVPTFAAKNRIIFGYYGEGDSILIEPLNSLPDSVKTKVLKERHKDTLNYWFTPTDLDSIIFTVTNEKLKVIDTFTVKSRKVDTDSLQLNPSQTGSLNFEDPFYITANTPITAIDTTRITLMDKDSTQIYFTSDLDTLQNKIDFDFEVEPNQNYQMGLLPGAITNFFGETNDTLNLNLATKSFADYGNLSFNVVTDSLSYPLLVQLTDEKGEIKREIFAEEPKVFEFNHLQPSKYLIRIIFDVNGNKKWDTGSYLKRIQPEKVSYYPEVIDVRANWEMPVTFTLLK
ncbi:Ig-like domain-containing protein [uncultured Kriegella sp.]|uniref:Ig-like domain-containing protein n=1 Tax=uncultured Kriegella sp. TaxID=1798910 RepID=UPI0030D893BD|tara:strand:- start:287899 stop:289515 length:1617 start_codon:yes stop_codon:yes gene_type:complete